MKDLNIKEIEYKNFGKCLEISNNIVKLIVTIDIGPRIINYSFLDGENIMHEDLKRLAHNDHTVDIFGDVWYNYGGHRLWASPEEAPRSYYPHNSPVEYEVTDDGVTFIQKKQNINNFQCEITVNLSENSSDVTVSHKITNCGLWDISLAPWAITMLSEDGLLIVPQPVKDTGLISNRLLAIWPYTKMTDSRVFWGNRYIAVKHDSNVKEKFKFGINSEHGFSLYFNHGNVFIKKFDLIENGTYPDGGMSFECYADGRFIEMESLGEYKTIKPGESVCHNEYWSLLKGDMPSAIDEEMFDLLVKKYIKD